MKVRAASDWHLEFFKKVTTATIDKLLPPMETDADTVLCLAGDIGKAHEAGTWLFALRYLAPRFKAICYVAGNHEWYGNNYYNRVSLLKREVKLPKNVHFLNDDAVEIDGTVFIGSTLWTDMNDWDELTMGMAYLSMTDYRAIKNGLNMPLQVSDTILMHEESRKFIFEVLTKAKDKKTVVMTHHLPSYDCVSSRFVGDSLNPCFATELKELILKEKPDLWIMGHSHDSYSGVIGDTKMVLNPYGYWNYEVNPKYDPELIIEV